MPRTMPMPVIYKIDQTLPVTTASVAGTTGCALNTYNSGATVTLSASESATIQYRINGGAWQTYSGPIVLTGAGVHTIEFFATDLAGNVEATKSVAVTIRAFPQNGVLDTFNRANGALGVNWSGATGTGNYQIVSQRMDVRGDGPIYWNSGLRCQPGSVRHAERGRCRRGVATEHHSRDVDETMNLTMSHPER